MGISRSGYYEARQRQAKVSSVCVTNVHLQAAFHAAGASYASRRLQATLRAEGLPIGRYRVPRLMHLHGLRLIRLGSPISPTFARERAGCILTRFLAEV
jgi:putative transposase